MNARLHASLFVSLLSAPAALADVTYSDFSSTAGLELVGAAGQSGNALRLTPATPNEAGAAWATTRQDVTSPFTCQFTFRASGGADGLAFVVQRDAVDAIGAAGEELGYGGIANSIAIEFDTFGSLLPLDPSENHVSVHTGGAGPNSASHTVSLGASSLLPDLDDDAVHTVRIEYVPGMLQVFVDDTIPALQIALDVAATLGLPDGTAWVGFTAATGGTTQTHDVLSWTFDEQSSVAPGNRPPAAPNITEPSGSGQPVNPFDVHMEAGPFVDPDMDDHPCSDFEIWTMMPTELVWRTACIGGPPKVHSHLGDGTFMGSHAGRTSLLATTSYVFRVRFRDDSGDGRTDWGAWSERVFQTGAAGTFYSMDTDDIVQDPAPMWTFAASGSEPVLPVSNPPARIVLDSAAGPELMSIESNDGVTNTVVDQPQLPAHVDVRLRIEAGGAGLVLPETDLVVVDHECDRTRVLVPAINLAPNTSEVYWISSDGSTWTANSSQTEPDFTDQVRGLSLPWVAAQPGYQVEVVASGFRLPVNIAFVPNPGTAPGDPYFYVSELYGTIKVVTNDGTVGVYADNLLNFNPTGAFPGSGEQGLAGVVVDPATGDVYAGMLYAQGTPHYPKVVRFTSNDGGLTAATETIILDMNGESQGQSHFISHFEMLADRTLLVHMGDGFVASTARNLNSFRGKILRMNLDGSPPTDNPFFNGAPFTARDYVYVLGVRNPFGGRFRAADGFHYCVENGPTVDRFARIVPGRDYRWAGSDSHMSNFALYNWSPASGPVAMAWIEEETFGGSGFPVTKWDRAFVTESGGTYAAGPQFNGKCITEFQIDDQGNLLSGPTRLIEYAGTGRATVAGMAAGPDGLYFTDLYRDTGSNPTAPGANILRVRWVGAQLGSCGTIGTPYCEPAVANSTGFPAVMAARGSDHVSDNDLQLDVEQLPPFSTGYCLASLTQGFSQMPGGSNGNLCLAGTIGRFVQLAQNSGPAGTFTVMIDLANFPPPINAVQVGETWNFQAWYRDFQLVATSNFTNGVSITFH
ncbi:MAG: PQQ-dependent sugar dehydrogenase [Planctomycetota bacterium]